MAHRIAPRIAISALLCLIPALAWGQTRWGNLPVLGSVPNLPSPSGLVAGDLDGDGRLDIVATHRDDGGFSVLKGQ